ncbi:MAG: ABC transporter permease [Anaerolineae bacterium]
MNKLLLRKTWRDLRKSRAQSIALIVIVMLGIASLIALLGAYRDLGTSYQATYDRLKFADVTFEVDGAPTAVLDEVAAVDGVTAVTGRLVVDSGYELSDGDQIRARLIGLPGDGQPDVNQILIEDGRMLQPGDTDAVVVESHFAKFYDLKPGDSITPIINGEKTRLTIVGTAASPEYLIVSPSKQDILPSARTFAVLFLPLADLQAGMGLDDTVNNIAVLVRENADREQVIAQIKPALEPYQLESTTVQEDVPSNAALKEDLAGYNEIAGLMPTLILLVAAISVYVMLGRLVKAQQPQIGLMKALGYGRREILGHYLAFALVIGVIGLVVGLLLGPPMTKGIVTGYAGELGIPLVETRFYPDLMAVSVIVAIVVALLAGLGPARGSANLEPAQAMRLDPSVALVNGRRSFIERLIHLPINWRLPLRNVFRMRRRSLTTGLGLIFAYILVLMVWGMLDSMNYMIDHNFRDVEQWDVLAIFDTPQTTAVVDIVEKWDGVQTIEPAFQLPATLKADGSDEDVLLSGFTPDQQMHMLELPDGVTPQSALANGQIILTDGTAKKFGLAVGDEIKVSTPFGAETYTIGGLTHEMMSAAAYIAYDTLQAQSPLPIEVFNGLYLKVDAARAKQIKNDLYHLPGAASVQLKSDVLQDWESLMGLFYALMGVMLVFALAMSFALIFNAVTVNVMERQRELATMRSVGAGSGLIARLIIGENVILWLVTLVPGMIMGWYTAVQFGKAFSADLFTFDVIVSPQGYIITALGILATMLLAGWPAIRRVNRLNLAEATKVLT